jgi:glycosyltransferase involved in cell wall biosynthesis
LRVVHFNTYELKGGAARSAVRLHEGFRALGVDSTLLVRSAGVRSETVHEAPPFPAVHGAFWKFVQREYVVRNRTPLSDTWFSAGYPGVDVADDERVRAADVLHLHWVSEFLSPPAIAALAHLGKPLVWTLHDQRAFTGGCHFSAGCRGFESKCEPCPQLAHDPCRLPGRNLRDQARLWPASHFTIVAPSRWLADAARRSVIFAKSRIEVIPYGIDTAAFTPMPRSAARKQLGLPENGRSVLFGADAAEERKGSHLLVEAFRGLPAELAAQTDLLYFGRRDARFDALGTRVRYLGYLRTPGELRAAYAAATLFVLPSIEDNLPNTLLEALACGTPVVAFATGGIPDVIEDGANGRLVPIGDVEALTTALAQLLEAPERAAQLGAEGARRAAAQFPLDVQARRYLELYQSLPSPPAGSVREPGKTGREIRAALLPLYAWSVAHRLGLR